MLFNIDSFGKYLPLLVTVGFRFSHPGWWRLSSSSVIRCGGPSGVRRRTTRAEVYLTENRTGLSCCQRSAARPATEAINLPSIAEEFRSLVSDGPFGGDALFLAHHVTLDGLALQLADSKRKIKNFHCFSTAYFFPFLTTLSLNQARAWKNKLNQAPDCIFNCSVLSECAKSQIFHRLRGRCYSVFQLVWKEFQIQKRLRYELVNEAEI